ncbi:MAG: hypothetical protein KC620_06850, partial [Myxococcales bacterium]|nr:hypothetical protein [Myxococcales bacterium]
MRVDRLLLLGAVAALTVGCQQDSGGNEPVPDAAVIDRGLADAERLDAAPMPDEGPMLDEGSPADAMSDGPIADAEADGAPPPPDMGGPRVVESCEQACAVYAECDRLDLFGDEAACLDRCARVTRTGVAVAQGWWDCLAVEQCNLVHLCPIPRLMPLTCDEICGALDDCDTGLPFNDCPATCAAGARAFQDCGEALFGGCDAEGFVDCLGHDVYPACADYCPRGAGCNVIRPEGCLAECVGHITLGDPLAAAQQSRINQCVRLAGEDCQRVDECVQPFSFEPPGVVAEAEFCRLYDACNFEFGDPCPGFYANAVRQGSETVACMVGIMRGACPDFSFDLEDLCSNAGGQVVAEACSRFCGAQMVCDVLDGAQAQCNLDCNSAFGDDPDLNERVGSQVLCAGSGTCPDLVDCLANASPEGQCERYCGRLDECGALPPNCQADCDAAWPRDRFAAVRQCVADAAD